MNGINLSVNCLHGKLLAKLASRLSHQSILLRAAFEDTGELKGTGIIVRVSLNDHAFALAWFGLLALEQMYSTMLS